VDLKSGQDTIRDAAIGAFVYRLAPSFGGSYARFTAERNGDQVSLITAEEQKLIRALRMDSEKLITSAIQGERSEEAVDLTGIDIKAEVEELEPEIKLRWYKWLKDPAMEGYQTDVGRKEYYESLRGLGGLEEADEEDLMEEDESFRGSDDLEEVDERENSTEEKGKVDTDSLGMIAPLSAIFHC
jgi:hypothetical protein